MERGDEIIEDGAWLRKADDGTHINLAELNAVIKGVNLHVKWGTKNVAIMTDSAAVHSWMLSMLKRDKRIRVSSLSKMLVKRSLLIHFWKHCRHMVYSGVSLLYRQPKTRQMCSRKYQDIG